MSKKILTILLAAGLGLTSTAVLAQGSPTLEAVKGKGFLQCGVTEGTVGFSAPDADNKWAGIDVEYCRAIAAAIFNDADAVRYSPLSSPERFTALSAGEVDLLVRTTTWTMSRDTQQGVIFGATNYYDGQGFIVRKADGIASALELGGAALCIEAGTTTELNAADYFESNGLEYNPVVFTGQDEAWKAYEDGRCDVMTTDSSALASNRSVLQVPTDHIILPEIISKEPLASVVRQGDDVWLNLVRWTHYAMLEAEELGVSSQNVDEMLGSDNPAIKRLLGVEGDFGTSLGLDKDWAYRILKLVGNYAEVFDKTIGPTTPIALERGINALWNDGGIQYSPPIR
jgi:general L-amino acid transport system substrate-binding protein